MGVLYLGVVYNVETKEIKAVINHPDDSGLDDPNWIEPTEPDEKLAMLKVSREQLFRNCPDVMGTQDCLLVMDVAKKILGTV